MPTDRPAQPSPSPVSPTDLAGSAVRVGVLLCDHLDEAVLAEGHHDYPERYRRLLVPVPEGAASDAPTDATERPLHPVVFDLTAGEMPEDPSQCEAWLIGGSRLDALGEDGFVPELVDFSAATQRAGIPQVGICFGHQVLARALGGAVERADGWGAGVRTYELVGTAPWIEPTSPPGGEVAIVASHRDQVTRLPPGADLLLRAPYCPIAGFRVGDTAFGVQGHPEFDAALSRTLTTRRRRTLGEPTATEALATLHRRPDDGLVNGWIRRFLTGAR